MNRLSLFFGFALALAMVVPAFAQGTLPPTNEGAFEALPTGNQKIVNSIYESHLDTGNVSLTKDDIAAMKADTGWGNAYKQLHEQGLVTHRNLGQAIKAHNHPNTTTTTPTVVTTGTGQKIVTGGKKDSGTNPSSSKGGNAGSQGGGNKFGHSKNSGITTGAGGTVGAGAASHSTAGGTSFGGAGGSKGRGKGGSSHKGK